MTITLFSPVPTPQLYKQRYSCPTYPSLLSSSSSNKTLPLTLCSPSTTPTSIISPSPDELAVPDQSTNRSGCKACGREEMESGCNGEGRIQGGIATFPGFGWWPIKAYRPCPGFVASGGRYRRQGQSMDEVVSGSSGKKPSSPPPPPVTDDTKPSKKKEGPKKVKG